MAVYLGTAGWPIPQDMRSEFAEGWSLLEKYGHVFNAVEINSTKLNRQITHDLRLRCTLLDLEETLTPILSLRNRFGCLRVQLTPSLSFDQVAAAAKGKTETLSAVFS